MFTYSKPASEFNSTIYITLRILYQWERLKLMPRVSPLKTSVLSSSWFILFFKFETGLEREQMQNNLLFRKSRCPINQRLSGCFNYFCCISWKKLFKNANIWLVLKDQISSPQKLGNGCSTTLERRPEVMGSNPSNLLSNFPLNHVEDQVLLGGASLLRMRKV